MDALASAALAGARDRTVRAPPLGILTPTQPVPPTNPNVRVDVLDPVDSTVFPGFGAYPPAAPVDIADGDADFVDQLVFDGVAFFGADPAAEVRTDFQDIVPQPDARTTARIRREIRADRREYDVMAERLAEGIVDPSSWLGPFDYAAMHAVLASIEPQSDLEAYTLWRMAQELEDAASVARVAAALGRDPASAAVAGLIPQDEIAKLAREVLATLFPAVEVGAGRDVFDVVTRAHLSAESMRDAAQVRGFHAFLLRVVSQRMRAREYVRANMSFRRFVAVYVLAQDRRTLGIRDLQAAYAAGRLPRAQAAFYTTTTTFPDDAALRLWIGRRMFMSSGLMADDPRVAVRAWIGGQKQLTIALPGEPFDEAWPFKAPVGMRLPVLQPALTWPFVLAQLDVASVPAFMYAGLVRRIRVNGDPVVITAPLRSCVSIITTESVRWFAVITDPDPAPGLPDYTLSGLPVFELEDGPFNDGHGVVVKLMDRAAYVFGLAEDGRNHYKVTRFAHVIPEARCVRCRAADFRDHTVCRWDLPVVVPLEGLAALQQQHFTAAWHARQVADLIGYEPPADFPYMVTAAVELWSERVNLERAPPEPATERAIQRHERHVQTLQQILLDMDLRRPAIDQIPHRELLLSIARNLQYTGRPVDTEAREESRRLRALASSSGEMVTYEGAHSASSRQPDFIHWATNAFVLLRPPSVLADSYEHRRLIALIYDWMDRGVRTNEDIRRVSDQSRTANSILLDSNPSLLKTPMLVLARDVWEPFIDFA